MRILYLDIDSLRPDHLGCYGYPRDTSPNIDRLAGDGLRCTNYYTPDAPCLPSRTALFSGRFGIHTGVVNHGGTAADLWLEGPPRGFRSEFSATCWMSRLRQAGHYTAMISPFAERHSAHWFNAGFNEIHNTGKGGLERADEIEPVALDWLHRRARHEHWFCHVNLWDPHTPYRTPESFGEPFAGAPLAGWYTEELRQQQFASFGTHSAHAPHDIGVYESRWPRMPAAIASMDDYRHWIDGYDTGIRYADQTVGRLLNALADKGVLDETLVIVSADHGENQGELNIFGDHQTADHITSRVPLVARGPGVAARVDEGLYYNFDLAATVTEMAGGSVPDNWDGHSFATDRREGRLGGRDELVVSQCAWSCQRSVRWGQWMLIRTYHAGWKDFPPVMLYDVAADPHELHDLAGDRPEVVNEGLARLERWTADQMACSPQAADPLWVTMREGGPLHTQSRRQNAQYLERLRTEGKGHWADRLLATYGDQGPAA